MEKRKRLLALLLIPAILLALSACGKESRPTVPSDATKAPEESSAPADGSDPTQPIVPDIDLAGQWVKPNAEQGTHFAFRDEGFYYISGVLRFMDTANGTSVPLCYKAGCKHDDEDCEAGIGYPNVFFCWDGHIYFDKRIREDPNGIHLFRRNADGTGEEKVATLAEEYYSQKNSVGVAQYIAADGVLYCVASIIETVEIAPNEYSSREQGTMILRLDLRTGKQEELVRYDDTYIKLLGARDNALLFYTQETPSSEDIFAPDYSECLQALPARLNVWTESSGKAVALFEKPNKECPWICGLMGSTILYTDYTNQYAYDLGTGTHSTVNIPSLYIIVNDNYLLDQSPRPEDMLQGVYAKFWDIRTGKHIPSDFDDADISLRSISEKGCIADIHYIKEMEPGGGGYIIHTSREIRAYVPFAAMEDGLQESDLLVISDEKKDS